MQDTYTVTPTIIERWVIADKVEVAGVPHPDDDGEVALLVFTNTEQAEAFRAATGLYPASEGCEVVAVDVDGLRNIIGLWGYSTIALCGLEPGGGADCFDAEAFCELLELAGTPREG
jgi:hypothetical protein